MKYLSSCLHRSTAKTLPSGLFNAAVNGVQLSRSVECQMTRGARLEWRECHVVVVAVLEDGWIRVIAGNDGIQIGSIAQVGAALTLDACPPARRLGVSRATRDRGGCPERKRCGRRTRQQHLENVTTGRIHHAH